MTRPTVNPPALRELLDDATLADLRDLGDEAERLTPEVRKFAEKVWKAMDRYYTAAVKADHADEVQDFMRIHSGAERLQNLVVPMAASLLLAAGLDTVHTGWFDTWAGDKATSDYYRETMGNRAVVDYALNVARARAWIEDVIVSDVPVDHLTEAQVRDAIDRAYEGGWEQFVKDGQPD